MVALSYHADKMSSAPAVVVPEVALAAQTALPVVGHAPPNELGCHWIRKRLSDCTCKHCICRRLACILKTAQNKLNLAPFLNLSKVATLGTPES